MFDEIGRLYYHPLGWWGPYSWKRLSNQKYWDSRSRYSVEKTWDVASSPSMAGLNLCNESYHYEVYATGTAGQDKLGERFFSLAEDIRKKVWPGFWFIADGDENLGGRLDFTSFHYLNHGYAFRQYGTSSEGGFAKAGQKVTCYPPDSFFLNGAAEVPRKGAILPLPVPDWRHGSTACGDTECFWMTGVANGTGICKYVGDLAAVSPAYRMASGPGLAWIKTAVDAYRDMEHAITGGIYWQGFHAAATQDVTLCMPQQEVRYYACAPRSPTQPPRRRL